VEAREGRSREDGDRAAGHRLRASWATAVLSSGRPLVEVLGEVEMSRRLLTTAARHLTEPDAADRAALLRD
jgi:hypothetical protein